MKTAEKQKEIHDQPGEERLYFVRHGFYIQYNGLNEPPEALANYSDQYGRPPPYIPLPKKPVEFDLFPGSSKIRWSGKGPLPEQVLEYVKENGMLPHNNGDSFLNEHDRGDD
ncbi:hypothetical protein ACFLS1_07200 [Verrucomicrobiota bacterium]